MSVGIKTWRARWFIALCGLFVVVSRPVFAQDQGFAVDAGAQVIVGINGIPLSIETLSQKFTRRTANGYDMYIAKAGEFDGSERITVDAVIIDAAGNRSHAQSERVLDPIDTSAPEKPQIAEIDNDYSSGYSDGFAVTRGASPQVSINGLLVQDSDLELWFERQNNNGLDLYIARAGQFDGSEEVAVTAYQVDKLGNRSEPADLLALRPIDTLSPAAPTVLSLNELLAGTTRPDAKPEKHLSTLNEIELSGSQAVQILNIAELESPSAAEVLSEDLSENLFDTSEIPSLNLLAESTQNQAPSAQTSLDAMQTSNVEAAQLSDMSAADLLDYVDSLLTDDPVSTTTAAELASGGTVEETVTDIADKPPVSIEPEKPEIIVTEEFDVDIPVAQEDTERIYPSDNAGDRDLGSSTENELQLVVGEQPQIDPTPTGKEVITAAVKPPDVYVGSDNIHTNLQAFPGFQSDIPAELLAAANGLDPFVLLNIERDATDVQKKSLEIGETLAKAKPPDRPPAVSVLFDIRAPVDMDRLLSWIAEHSESEFCHAIAAASDTSITEIISCLDSLGYPQAVAEDLPDGGVRIDTGQKMRVEKLDVSGVLAQDAQLDEAFVSDLESKPLSKARHVKALSRLESLGFLKDGTFDYYETGPGEYEAYARGEAGGSTIGVGASITSGGELFGGVSGRHYFDLGGLRYVEYSAGSDTAGEFELSASVPIYYDIENVLSLAATSKPEQFHNFDARESAVSAIWERDAIGNADNLHLAEVRLSVSQHDLTATDPAAKAFEDGDAESLSLGAEARFEKEKFVLDSDSLAINLGLHRQTGDDPYLRTDLEYESGQLPLADTGLNLAMRGRLSALLGNLNDVSADNRLYLGGAESIRGVANHYLGSSEQLSDSGGSFSGVSQVELSKSVSIAGQELDLGVHVDAGFVSGGHIGQSPESAMSYGFFGRTEVGSFGTVYGYLSRANVASEGKAALGIGILKRF